MSATRITLHDGEAGTLDDSIDALKASTRAQIEINEDVQQIAARLAASLDKSQRIILVTSYDDRDGGSELAAHLAIGLSRILQTSVALVDGNRHNPSLGQMFGEESGPGFGDLVDGTADLADVLRGVAPEVTLITAGSQEGSLSLPSCTRVINLLRERFRYVVVAGGPVLQQPESVTLVSLSDGVVLALRAGLRRRDEIQELQRELMRLKAHLLGAVLRGKR